MRATLLACLAALPAAGADHTHAELRETHAQVQEAMEDGARLLAELAALRGRYGADMDTAAVEAERAALLARLDAVYVRYGHRRRELLDLRRRSQGEQIVRLVGRPGKEDFAAGLVETLEAARLVADVKGFPRSVEQALAEDAAAFESAKREAEHARRLRRVLAAAGAAGALAAVLLAVLPRRPRLGRPPPSGPDAPRLEAP